MRVVLLGTGPVLDAVQAALGGDIVAVYSSPQPTDVLRAAQADIGLAIGYRPKVSREERDCFVHGVLNLHFSLLPWNAGVGGNVWPLIEGSRAGVTLHWMDDDFDAGPTLLQWEVPVEPWDTAGTLFQKQQDAALQVILAWHRSPYLQRVAPGTVLPVESRHYRTDFTALDFPDLDAPTTLRQALNLLRAKTCPPYPGLRYRQDGKLIEATITLKEVTE